MAVYRFRYASSAGLAIRTTIMQCADDFEAIRKAGDTMQDRYASVEIFEGERLIDGAFPLPGTQRARQTPQSPRN